MWYWLGFMWLSITSAVLIYLPQQSPAFLKSSELPGLAGAVCFTAPGKAFPDSLADCRFYSIHSAFFTFERRQRATRRWLQLKNSATTSNHHSSLSMHKQSNKNSHTQGGCLILALIDRPALVESCRRSAASSICCCTNWGIYRLLVLGTELLSITSLAFPAKQQSGSIWSVLSANWREEPWGKGLALDLGYMGALAYAQSSGRCSNEET